jgi:hypothetical protein
MISGNFNLILIVFMVSLFTVALVISFVENAYALKAKHSPGYVGTKHYGQKTSSKVCGDELCPTKSNKSFAEKTQGHLIK